MAVSSGTSFVLSSCLCVVLFAGMQIYKSHLVSTQLMTVLGGYLGSLLFILILTYYLDSCFKAIGNLETSLFGKTFQTKLFPEVVICMAVSMFASGLVHRVCVTTCFLFSLLALYYMNRISIKAHGHVTSQFVVQPVKQGKKK